MSAAKKKKKVIRARIIFVLALLIVAAVIWYIRLPIEQLPEFETKEGWIRANQGESVQLFSGEETIERNWLKKIVKRDIVISETDKSLQRGSSLVFVDDPFVDENGQTLYEKVRIEGIEYYVKPGYFTDDYQKVITETEKYIRTAVTLYESPEDVVIAGFVKKGNKAEVTGFDYLNEDGSVNMYKINCNGQEGYAFAKYLVDDQTSADAVYNEIMANGSACADYNRDLDWLGLYGGTGNNLDWYPVEKVDFTDQGNTFCEDARTMYISCYGSYGIDKYIECAKTYGVNAICVDIFDPVVSFDCEATKKYCPSAYANLYEGAESFGPMIKAIKDAGIYVIGRIVVFNDSWYSKDHPEDCIDYYGTDWPSVFSRGIWEYKVSMAVEAVEKFGFDEIQFDYVRFPESSYTMSASGVADFKNVYGEEKCDAVQNFLFYATDMVHRAGAYVSVDVFGESSFGYMPAYGQYWPCVSNIVDAISGMPYTDHFETNIPERWEDPYTTVNNWAYGAAKLQKVIPTPATARTWVTAWDTPWWNPYVHYGAQALSDQAQGLWDAGLTGGFLTWGACELDRYYEFSWAWAKQY